jgi:hypothetical protein
MSDQELLAIVIMVIAGCTTVTRLGMAWINRGGARSAAGPSAVTAPEVESRLVRIEHAVDSIAVEVERAAENQRFATRLLSERSPTDAGAARAREITHAR